MSEEEIDIIELLKRVKEGKAPKKIEIDNYIFEFDEEAECIESLYNNVDYSSSIVETWFDLDILFDTKIKILDKPIIEELEMSTDDERAILISKNGRTYSLRMIDIEIIDKINEIIRYIKKEEK